MSQAQGHDLRQQARGLAACLLLLLPPPVLAQGEGALESALRGCASLRDDTVRLACFDGIVELKGAPVEPVTPPTGAPEPDASGAAERAVERGPEPAAASSAASGASAGALAGSSPSVTAASASTSAVAASEPRTLEPRDTTPSNVRAQPIPVVIVQVGRLRANEARFLTAEGVVLTQSAGRALARLPDVPFDAVIEEGALGSLFLRLPDDGPRVRVSRD